MGFMRRMRRNSGSIRILNIEPEVKRIDEIKRVDEMKRADEIKHLYKLKFDTSDLIFWLPWIILTLMLTLILIL